MFALSVMAQENVNMKLTQKELQNISLRVMGVLAKYHQFQNDPNMIADAVADSYNTVVDRHFPTPDDRARMWVHCAVNRFRDLRKNRNRKPDQVPAYFGHDNTVFDNYMTTTPVYCEIKFYTELEVLPKKAREVVQFVLDNKMNATGGEHQEKLIKKTKDALRKENVLKNNNEWRVISKVIREWVNQL
jgi:hypothetical protein